MMHRGCTSVKRQMPSGKKIVIQEPPRRQRRVGASPYTAPGGSCWLGRSALKTFLTRSYGPAYLRSLVAVRTTLSLHSPCKPKCRIKRLTVPWAMKMPSRSSSDMRSMSVVVALAIGSMLTSWCKSGAVHHAGTHTVRTPSVDGFILLR